VRPVGNPADERQQFVTLETGEKYNGAHFDLLPAQ
jgi:hypothetical protein